jgi:hypothetical protein
LTLGGYGHQESGALHIASTSEGTIFDSFLEHGDIIKDDKTKKVVFLAFSEDETKIMSMSKDGVVIVRNIDLSKFEDRKPADNIASGLDVETSAVCIAVLLFGQTNIYLAFCC